MPSLFERNIIAGIARQQKNAPTDLIKGIGDDCAVVRKSPGVVELWTTDTLVEGVHFDSSWHPPDLLGRKAASVNISDIGAMGGTPRFALLSLGMTARFGQDWVDQFTSGFLAVLAQYDMALVGGDTVFSGERLMMSVTVCGEMKEEQICYRSRALVGDRVWVSGNLGNGACGLELCRKGMQDNYPLLRNAHLDPVPQVVLGQDLAASGLVHAMMDLSDGLATDLAHICKASGVGAEVIAEDVPMAAELVDAAGQLQLSPLKLALQGGEDYQLIFTAPEESGDALIRLCQEKGFEISSVGRIVQGEGVVLCQDEERRDISFGGYEHRV